MNDDFAAERFNVPKAEVVDWLVQTGRKFGVHWWVGASSVRLPASMVSANAASWGPVLAPTLADLDAAVVAAGATATDRSYLAEGRNARICQLKATLTSTFSSVDIVFIDPDNGITDARSPRPLGRYITVDEVSQAASKLDLAIYHHLGRVVLDATGTLVKDTPSLAAGRVRKMLQAVGITPSQTTCWSRDGAGCLVVCISCGGARTSSTSFSPPQPPWTKV